ncbi:hypothetical protein [Campylobacter majalis]
MLSDIFGFALQYSGFACALFLIYEMYQNKKLQKRIKDLENRLKDEK